MTICPVEVMQREFPGKKVIKDDNLDESEPGVA